MSTAIESLTSIGKLADEWDVRRDEVRVAAERAGVKPAVSIDSTPFYATADKPAIREHLAQEAK